MKSSILWFTLVTHVMAGVYGYRLGMARMASEHVLKFSYQADRSLLAAIPNQQVRLSPKTAPQPDALPSSMPQAMAEQGFRGRLDRWMAATESMDSPDVLAYLQALRHRPGTSDGLMAQQLLLARFAELDPKTALSYVDSLQGFHHEMGQQTVISAWAAKDPVEAARYFDSLIGDVDTFDSSQSAATAGTLAAEWARQDPDRALEWADSLPDDLRGEAFGRIMAQLSQDDLGEAAELLTAMEPGYERTGMLETLVDQWAHRDPEEAAGWVLEHTEDADRLIAVESLMGAWMISSPMDASRWLAELPDGEAKDSAILAMTASRAVQRDPEANVAWSAAIQDPALRTEAVESALGDWLASDPQRAEAWLRDQSQN